MGDRRPIVIAPDDAIVYRAAEVIAMVNAPGANVRSVAADLGMVHSTLWRHLRKAGYRADERWTLDESSDA